MVDTIVLFMAVVFVKLVFFYSPLEIHTLIKSFSGRVLGEIVIEIEEEIFWSIIK